MDNNEMQWSIITNSDKMNELRILAQDDEGMVIRVENESGEGDMIFHMVFDGVYLMYNDFHMYHYYSFYQPPGRILAIDYCREGSLSTNSDGDFKIKNAGNICIDSRSHHGGECIFATGHFHGISIGLDTLIASKALATACPGIPIDIDAIREKFCGKNGYYMIRANDTLQKIFTDLYRVPAKAKISYFRAKVIELLVCLSVIDKEPDDEKTYFYKDQVEKVRAIKALIISDLTQSYTIEELAQNFQISQTSLKKCFKEIYGKPISSWLREYRINTARELLIEDKEKSIGDIAFLVGYESAGKFSAVFKKQCGLSPKDYRRQPH